jgi:hypothetical protein
MKKQSGSMSHPPDPRDNCLFAALPQEDAARLLPHLEPVQYATDTSGETAPSSGAAQRAGRCLYALRVPAIPPCMPTARAGVLV